VSYLYLLINCVNVSFIHLHHIHYLFLVYARHSLNHVVIFLSFSAPPLAQRSRQPSSSPNVSDGPAYTLDVRRTPNHSNSDVAFTRPYDQGKIMKKDWKIGRLSDFLSHNSKWSYFNLLDLADFLMHHQFPLSFVDVASNPGCAPMQPHTALAMCAAFRASSLIGSSGWSIILARTTQARICSVPPV